MRILILTRTHKKKESRPRIQDLLTLLSRHDLDIPTRFGLRPIYKSLCDWLLSDQSFDIWVGATNAATTPSTPNREETIRPWHSAKDGDDMTSVPIGTQEPIAKAIRILEVPSAIQDTSILTSSLISSIRSKRHGEVDSFVTISHHYPRPFPLHKAQLLASLCRQLLTGRPKLFAHVRTILEQTREAFYGYNSAWKEASLWRVLKQLLSSQAGGQSYIIIHQPSDIDFAIPFVDLIADLQALAKTNELACRILAIRIPLNSAPWNNLFSLRLLAKDNPQIKSALLEDFERILQQATNPKPSVQMVKRGVIGMLIRDDLHLQKLQHCLALLDCHPSLSLQPVVTTVFDQMHKDYIGLILEQIPTVVQPWIRTGLLWVTHAIRPLTVDELSFILSKGTMDASREPRRTIVEDFVYLLCGLVEIEGGRAYVMNPELFQYIVRPSQREYSIPISIQHDKKPQGAGQRNYEQDKEVGQGEGMKAYRDELSPLDVESKPPWYSYGRHGHTVIAKTCLSQIVKPHVFGKDPSEANLEPESRTLQDDGGSPLADQLPFKSSIEDIINVTEQEADPLLPYSIEHWFDHAKQSESSSAMHNAYTDAFLTEDRCVDYWITQRARYRQPNTSVARKEGMPSLSMMMDELRLKMSNGRDIVKAIDILSVASTIRMHSEAGRWASIPVAVSQLGDTDLLRKLADKGHLSNDSVLTAVFETGTEIALRSLIEIRRDWIRNNVHKIFHDALRMGNFEFALALWAEFSHSINFSNYQTPPIHLLAENHTVSLPNQLWDVMKSHAGSDSKGRTPLHSAALSGHFTLVAKLLSIKDQSSRMLNSQDMSKSSPLLLAASTGQFAVVQELVATGADINLCNDDNQSPLNVASYSGYVDIVQYLLSHGSKIGLTDSRGKTALHRAIENGHEEVALAILRRAKAYTQRQDRDSSLMICYERQVDVNGCVRGNNKLYIVKGNEDSDIAPELDRERGPRKGSKEAYTTLPTTIVENYLATILITESRVKVIPTRTSNICGVNTTNNEGLTPLHLAVKGNCLSIVRALLDLGVGVNQKCLYGFTPLHYAANFGFYQILDELLSVQGIDTQPGNDCGDTPLHLAAIWDYSNIIKKLLDKGAKFDCVDHDGMTPLAMATQWGGTRAVELLRVFSSLKHLNDAYLHASLCTSEDIIKLLLEAGASIDLLRPAGTTLHQACYMSKPKVVQILLTKRASLEALDDSKRTPLLDAARINSIDCLRLLVDAGANVNAEDEECRTPLLEAALRGHTACVHILLSAKAKLKIPSTMSGLYESSEDLALAKFNPEVFRIMADKISSGSIPFGLRISPAVLRRYLENDDYEIEKIRILLHNGFNPNQKLGSYGTMLHYAALWGRVDLAKVLVETDNIDINSNDKEHGTPLEVAAASGEGRSLEIVQLLLDEKANATIGSLVVGSPLHAAAHMPYLWKDPIEAEKIYLTVAELILDRYPSTIDLEAGIFATPLQAAAKKGQARMVILLLKKSPNFDIRGGIFGTPLHAAVWDENIPEICLILSRSNGKLTPATIDQGGRIPLHIAAMGGHEAIIDLITTDDISFLTRDLGGRHSLHFAAGRGCTGFVQKILSMHGDAINDTDADGWTPLHWACRRGCPTTIRLLVDHNADKEARTKRGWRPVDVAKYHYAMFQNPEEVIELVKPSPQEGDEEITSQFPSLVAEPTAEVEDEVEKFPVPQGKFIKSTTVDGDSRYYCDSCSCVSSLPSLKGVLWGAGGCVS